MRLFTPDEQELLRRISDERGPNLYSLIDHWIQGVSFRVNTQTDSVIFIFEQYPGLNLIDRIQEIQRIVIQSVNLVKLFEDRGYFFTYINSNQLPPSPFTFGQAAVNAPSISYQFPDPIISKLFCEYSVREIFLTPELEKFISDGFITREEVRANRQYKITKRALKVTTTALVISIVALLINIGLNIFKPTDKKFNIENSDVYIRTKRNCEMIYYRQHCCCYHKKNENRQH